MEDINILGDADFNLLFCFCQICWLEDLEGEVEVGLEGFPCSSVVQPCN